MVKTSDDLPDYARPPIIETVLGAEFAPVNGWTVAHYGLFWDQIKSDYPTIENRPPLGSSVVPPMKLLQAIRIEFQTASQPSPPIRCWYIDAQQSRLIQLQADRFLHNWRKVEGAPEYPRYPIIKEKFEAEWQRYCKFLDTHGLKQPEVTHCEVTYINHIEFNSGETPELFFAIFDSQAIKGPRDQCPTSISFSLDYEVPSIRGRLSVQVEPALRVVDDRQVLQFTLSAKGRPELSQRLSLGEWFDDAREVVVRAFDRLTSLEGHRRWHKKGEAQ